MTIDRKPKIKPDEYKWERAMCNCKGHYIPKSFTKPTWNFVEMHNSVHCCLSSKRVKINVKPVLYL